ncbi:MAG: TIGR00268 family protein [Granulosicoccus sp.]
MHHRDREKQRLAMTSNTSNQSLVNQERRLGALRATLAQYDLLAIAISGGVDSTTLAAVAHDVLGERALMVHATSPAVPPDATKRVQHSASSFGWNLKIVDAGEFSDEQYRQNPVNRCYYCKSNLYHRIHEVWGGTVASGANLDDLGDYRPGLLAASEKQVVHPLIDAGIDKATVRIIATGLGLESVADLPAQPCLSSRIETGIAIDAGDLMFVHKVETLLANRLGRGDIRCRITAAGVRIEVDDELQRVNEDAWQKVCIEVTHMIIDSNRMLAGFTGYERGSAFLKASEHNQHE